MRRHKVMLKLVYDMDDAGAEAILELGRKAMKDGWDEDLDQYVAEFGGEPLTQALYEYATAALWMALREHAEKIGQPHDFDVELVDDDYSLVTYSDERVIEVGVVERYPGEAAAKEAVARGEWDEA